MNKAEYQNLFIVPVCKVDLVSIDNLKLTLSQNGNRALHRRIVR